MAQKLGADPTTIKKWHKAGLIKGYPFNTKNECLYAYIEEEMPTKMSGVKYSKRKKQLMFNRNPEVQYAT